MFMVAPVHDVVNDLVLITDWYVHILVIIIWFSLSSAMLRFTLPSSRRCAVLRRLPLPPRGYLMLRRLQFLSIFLLPCCPVFVILSIIIMLTAVLGSHFFMLYLMLDTGCLFPCGGFVLLAFFFL